jgi:hypothetical protein
MKTLLALLLTLAGTAHAFSTCSWNSSGAPSFQYTLVVSHNDIHHPVAFLEMVPQFATRIPTQTAIYDITSDFEGDNQIFLATHSKGGEMYMPKNFSYEFELEATPPTGQNDYPCPSRRCNKAVHEFTSYLTVYDENKAQLAKCLL